MNAEGRFSLPAIDVEFGFEPPLIDRGDDAVTQSHFLELLEHKVVHTVGYTVETFHLAATFVLGRDEVVELVVIISGHTSRNLVARYQ